MEKIVATILLTIAALLFIVEYYTGLIRWNDTVTTLIVYYVAVFGTIFIIAWVVSRIN